MYGFYAKEGKNDFGKLCTWVPGLLEYMSRNLHGHSMGLCYKLVTARSRLLLAPYAFQRVEVY